MSYLPKSKITNKIAQASDLTDNFYTKSSPSNPYSGPYMETSEGKYFIGTNFITKGEELFKETSTSVKFGDSEDFKSYHKIKTTPHDFLKKINPIPGYKNKPIERDYERGYYNRYFSSRVNHQFGYQEISSKTYKAIIEETEKYDHYLYEVGLIKWALNGNVHSINQANLTTLERNYPFISNLFPILNEFHRPISTQTNLTTEGDELYFKDGTEYVGDYHIHPTKGPMVGATHVKSAHSKLYYSDQLPLSADRIDSTDKEFEKYMNKKRKRRFLEKTKNLEVASKGRTTDSSMGSTPSTSRGSTSTSGGGRTSTSGGGGGGY